jgi:hypothetical protein
MTVLSDDRLTLKCEVPSMVTELGARNMVLVPPCDVSRHTNWVEVIDLLFIDQYNLLLVCMYKKLFPIVHFRSFIAFFINIMVSSIFLYLYILFCLCRWYAKFGCLFLYIVYVPGTYFQRSSSLAYI